MVAPRAPKPAFVAEPPTQTTQNTDSLPLPLFLQESADMPGLRRELEQLAQRCRAFADVCDETAKRIDTLAKGQPSHALQRQTQPIAKPLARPLARNLDVKTVPLRVTSPKLKRGEIEVSLDWCDNEPTVIRPQSVATSRTTLPPPVLVACPSCGHGNGQQYESCVMCGCRLHAMTEAEEEEIEVVFTPTLGSRLRNFIQRLDPRRPRWLDPDVLESVDIPSFS